LRGSLARTDPSNILRASISPQIPKQAVRLPVSVAVAFDGSVYVSDRNNSRIQQFTSEGVFVGKWGAEGTGDGEFLGPEGVAVASDGSVYVAESEGNRIQKFAPGP
jgi:glucose/arabinose dehydrogenase